MRGAVKEVISIIGWVAAFYVAKTYAGQLLPLLPEDIPTAQLKILAAFLILFLAVILLASFLSIALSSLLSKVGLGWLNRLVGAIFGLARGMVIVCVMVMLAGMTALPKDERWSNAMFSAPLEALVTAMLPWVPSHIAQHVKFD
jgi:membrane protein required for colicin V production